MINVKPNNHKETYQVKDLIIGKQATIDSSSNIIEDEQYSMWEFKTSIGRESVYQKVGTKDYAYLHMDVDGNLPCEIGKAYIVDKESIQEFLLDTQRITGKISIREINNILAKKNNFGSNQRVRA